MTALPCPPGGARSRRCPGRRRGRRWDESGQVGGLEAVIFGVLVFVIGTLVVVNAWGVVNAKAATTAAAREAARTFVEAPSAAMAGEGADRAAREAMGGYHLPGAVEVRVLGTFERCARVEARVSYTVPILRLPFVDNGAGFGRGFHVVGHHSELVDPLRSGVGRTGAPCAG